MRTDSSTHLTVCGMKNFPGESDSKAETWKIN